MCKVQFYTVKFRHHKITNTGTVNSPIKAQYMEAAYWCALI